MVHDYDESRSGSANKERMRANTNKANVSRNGHAPATGDPKDSSGPNGPVESRRVAETANDTPKPPRQTVADKAMAMDLPSPDGTRASSLTDLSNAQEIVARHGGTLRYCHPWKTWLIWDGRQWKHDDTGQAIVWAKSTIVAMAREAAEAVGRISKATVDQDEDEQVQSKKLIAMHKARLAWAIKSQSRDRIMSALKLAESEPGIPILPNDLDRDPVALNVANGILDLSTGKLRPHDPKELHSKIADVVYDPLATCPVFEAFLNNVFPSTGDAAEVPGDEPLITFIQRLLGYCLTGLVSEQVLTIFWGKGSNGKSTLINISADTMGDYARKLPGSFLLASHGERHPTELAELFGRRLTFGTEPDEGRRLDEARIKELTGGDEISARRMRENFWTFKPVHKLVWAANHKPEARGTDHGLWRRLRLVPFTVRFWNPDTQIEEGEERPERLRQDKALGEKLAAERPGILAWVVRGCRDWQRHGLNTPEAVMVATREYRSEQDKLGAFIADRCFVSSDVRVKAQELYNAYTAWADSSGETALSLTRFGLAILEKGFTKKKIGNMWYLGIAPRNDFDEGQE